MRKISLLCFAVLFFFSPLHAQHWHMALKRAEKTLRQTTKKYQGNIEKALEKNISRAQAVHKAFGETSYFTPMFNRSYSIKEPIGMYKMDMVNGWTLEENKQFMIQRVIYERHSRQLLQANAFLSNNNIQTPGLLSAQDLAKLIPADKKYIFMGEYHHPQITQTLQETLKSFAVRHPDKKIIVFSEFMEEWGFDPEKDPLFKQYILPLEKAGISWVGLKESCPMKATVLSEEYNMPVQATLMGLKTRNEHWISIIKKWRQKYPDALFIIHAGAAHVDYWEPYSVSQRFTQEESFVVHFIPFFNGFFQYASEPFHQATNYIFYRPGVLRWKTPRAARLAGFDMQVILP